MENTTLPEIVVTPDPQPIPEGPGINISTPQTENPSVGISFTNSLTGTNLPAPPVALKRAKDTEFGSGEILNKTSEQLYSEYLSGQEDSLRKEAASKLDQNRISDRNKKIMDYAATKGGQLSMEEMQWALNPFQPTNPNSVLEKQYGTRFIKETVPAAARMDAPLLPEAMQVDPVNTTKAEELGSELTAKKLFASKMVEDLEKEVENQNTLPWLVDQAKNLSQVYTELKMRGNVEGTPYFSGFLGSNLTDQANNLMMQPMDDYQKNFKSVIDRLRKDNPTLALQFAREVYGTSNSERALNNLWTAMMIPDLAMTAVGVGKLARLGEREYRANKIFKDMVLRANEAQPPKAAAAEGAGDIAESAVLKTADDFINNRIETPKTASDLLPSTMDLTKNLYGDAERLMDNIGKSDRNIILKIKDRLVQGADKVVEAIENVSRLNRIPLASSAESAIRTMKNEVQEMYWGIKSNISDISDPIWHQPTATWHAEVKFTNIGDELFTSEETAKGFARMNGLGEVKVVEREGTLTPKAVQKLYDEKAKHLSDIEKYKDSLVFRKRELADKTTKPERKEWAKEQVKLTNNAWKKTDRAIANIDKQLADYYKGELTLKDGPIIRQKGMGYEIVYLKHLDETAPWVKNYTIRLGENAPVEKGYVSSALSDGPGRTWRNAIIGKFRGADDTLALSDTINRKVATYARKAFQEVADYMAKEIEQVVTGAVKTDKITGEALPWYQRLPINFYNKSTLKSKEMFEQFNETLKYARSAPDPDLGKTADGYYFRTPGELDDHYIRNYQRMPTFQEKQAYFSHVQLLEFDRTLGELMEFRNRSRLGVQQQSITLLDATGKKVTSEYFDGVERKKLPRTDDSILIMTGRLGEERLATLNKLAGPEYTRLKEGITNGEYRLIEIYNTDHYPLKNFSKIAGEEDVRYVLAKNVTSKPLQYNHIVRRAGGHFEYDYDFYIKQARMIPTTNMDPALDKRAFQHVYKGDTTVMPIKIRAMGEDLIKHLNNVRLLIKEGDDAAAKQYLKANEVGIEWKKIRSWFSEHTDPETGIKSRAMLSLDEPLQVVPKNRLIYDLDKSLQERYPTTFKDGTKSGSLGSQYKVAYNRERDAEMVNTINDYGTQGNPLYKYEAADMIDPIPAMNNAMDRMINSIFMDDYKTSAMQSWLREAEKWLKEDASVIQSSPYWVFHNTTSKDAFKPSAPSQIVANLLSNKIKIDQFIGVPDKFDAAVHALSQHLIDSAYTKYGSETGRTALQKATTLAPIWALSKIKDPIHLLRSFTFNAKLGLFAVPQLMVQMQTYASIYALEPRRGLAATYAMMLHQWGRINRTPEFIDTLDNMATKLNFGGVKWKRGEFSEAMKELDKTGFESVQGEYALLDNVKHKFIGDTAGNFLKAGQVFFREGERGVRLGAWYTAFKDWKDANPGKIIGNTERNVILNKADLLSNNMSRASNSMLHGGILSLPTQFLSYQLRLAELFWGKRLGETATERTMARARMVAVYAGLYGAPTALGITGLPLGDDIRQAYINNGYTPNEKFINTLLMEGLPSVTAAWISGGGNVQKGNLYNIGPRFGVGGFPQIQEAFKSDTPLLTMLGGASGSVLMNTLTSGDGFLRAMASMIRGEQGNMAYRMTPSTFLDPFNEISSVNSARRWLAAINTGKWFSKNQGYITDVSPWNATFMTLTGTSPLEQTDNTHKRNIMKENEAYQKDTLKAFITEFRRGAMEAGRNPELSKAYYANAFARLWQAGYPLEKRAAAVGIAAKGYESMIKSTDYDFAFKNRPQAGRTFFGLFDKGDKYDTKIQQYKATNKIRDIKEGKQ